MKISRLHTNEGIQSTVIRNKIPDFVTERETRELRVPAHSNKFNNKKQLLDHVQWVIAQLAVLNFTVSTSTAMVHTVTTLARLGMSSRKRLTLLLSCWVQYCAQGSVLFQQITKNAYPVLAQRFWCLSIENAARNHNKIFPEPPSLRCKVKGRSKVGPQGKNYCSCKLMHCSSYWTIVL